MPHKWSVSEHVLDSDNFIVWEDGMVTIGCKNCDATARLQATDEDWELEENQ